MSTPFAVEFERRHRRPRVDEPPIIELPVKAPPARTHLPAAETDFVREFERKYKPEAKTDFVKEFEEKHPPIRRTQVPLWRKPTRSFIAGWGDTIKSTGQALRWAGERVGRPGLGAWAIEAGEDIARRHEVPGVDEELKEFNFRDVLNPAWLATRVPRALPFSLSLIPAAIVGAYLGVTVGVPVLKALGIKKAATYLATKVGTRPEVAPTVVGAYGRHMIKALGGAVLARPMEGAMEAGEAHSRALAEGKTEEEAMKAGNEVFRRNLKLAGVDATQFFYAFPLLGKGKALTTTFARRIAATMPGRIAGVGVLEAGEEAAQDIFQRRAAGEEIKWDPRMKESAALGAIMGGGLGLGGSVYTAMTQRVIRNLPLYQQEQIRRAKEGKTGAEAQEAELLELDRITPTPEAQEAMTRTADEMLALGREFDREMGIPPDPAEVPEWVRPPEGERIIPRKVAPPAPEAVREEPIVEPAIAETPAIPKELEPLVTEARKFREALVDEGEEAFVEFYEGKGEKALIEKAGFTLDTFYDQAVRGFIPEEQFAPPVAETPAIPKELEPLAVEARKYRTAEEFVRSRGRPLYHGTAAEFEKFDITKAGTLKISDWGTIGIYFDPSKLGADYYRKEAIMVTDKKANKLLEKLREIEKTLKPKSKYDSTPQYTKEWEDTREEWLKAVEKAQGEKGRGEIIEAYIDPKAKVYKHIYETGMVTDQFLSNRKLLEGYDAIEIWDRDKETKKKWLSEVIVMNPDVIKTKSQLTDFYHQAVRGVRPAPEQERKRPELPPPPEPPKPLKLKTLRGWVREKGGLDPRLLEKDYDLKDVKEFGMGYLLKKGGHALDDLAVTAETEGVIIYPYGVTKSDYLMERLKDRTEVDMGWLIQTDEKIGRKFLEWQKYEEELAEWQKREAEYYGEEITAGEVGRVEGDIQKEIQGEEVARTLQEVEREIASPEEVRPPEVLRVIEKREPLLEKPLVEERIEEELEIRFLTPVRQRLKAGERRIEGEDFVVRLRGRPTTRALAEEYIADELKKLEKEILRAKTKPEKEAREREKEIWLEKIGLIVKDKYPFATKEQRRVLHATRPAIAKALVSNLDWDKLPSEQQAQIELSVKEKKDIPIEVMLDAIQKGNLLVPEPSIERLKYRSPIQEHLIKPEDRPKVPAVVPEVIGAPKRPVVGRDLTLLAERFASDLDFVAFLRDLPSYPEGIQKIVRDVAKEKGRLNALLERGEITKERVKEVHAKLDKALLSRFRELGIAERITEEGNVIPALRKTGHGVHLGFAKSPQLKDISGWDIHLGDPMTNAATISQADYGYFHSEVMEPTQALELAKDKVTAIYQHKLRQLAIKHGVLHASQVPGSKSKRERITLGKLMEVIGTKEMAMPVDKILRLDKVRAITDKRNLIEFVKDVRPILDEIWRVTNTFRVKYGKEPMGYIKKGYLPHMQEVATMSAILGKENKIRDIMHKGSLPDFIKPNQWESAHAKARKYRMDTYEMDFFNVFDRYVHSMMKSIFNTIVINNNKIHAEVMRDKELINNATWLDNWTAQSYAGVPGRVDKIVLEMSPAVYRALGQYRQMLNRMVFPFNIAWNIATQPSSITLTLGRMGPRHLAAGFRDWFITRKDNKKINQSYTYLVKNQDKGTLLRQDLDLEVNFLEKGVLDKWQDLGTILLRAIERHVTGWSIAAGYSMHRAKGLTGRALDYAAQAEGAFTQSMYNKSMRPLLLQSRVISATVPFQTFTFQLFNLCKEVAGITGKPRLVHERLAMAIYVLAGAFVWDEFSEMVAGRRIWNWQAAVPFAGAVWSPFDVRRSPISYVATWDEFMKGMDTYLTTGNFAPLRRTLVKYGTATKGIGGGLTMSRTIDAMIANYRDGIYSHDDELLVAIKEPEEKVRAFIFGPWATERGQAYWNMRDDPGLATKAYNWVIGKQPTSYDRMKDKIVSHIKRKGHRSIKEVHNDAELREMMAEFNVVARDRLHTTIFIRGFEDIMTPEEYYSELKRRIISYEDIDRWMRVK